MKHKIGYNENYVFLSLVLCVFLLGAYTLIKNPKKYSAAENRSLAQFSHFTVNDFLSGDFQDNFENALSDQFPMSAKIRSTYGEGINNLPTFGIDSLICKNRYIYVSGNKYSNTFFDCDDYIIEASLDINPSTKKKFKSSLLDKNIKNYSRANKLADTYYYYSEESLSYNFEKREKVIDIESILSKKLTGNYTLSGLKIDSYEDLRKYYYKTDHHWNENGQLKGYMDIVKMFGIEDINMPTALMTNHEYFFGSRARDAQNYNSKEEFNFYKYDLPEHDTYVNGKPEQYDHIEEYINHDYKYKRDTNYYGYVYGGDRGEVMFDFHQPDKGNLLIISNSFANPLKVLLAQYFNKTYSVDLRHYKDYAGKDFVLSDYVQKNHIDKILFLINIRFLYDATSNQGLEL